MLRILRTGPGWLMAVLVFTVATLLVVFLGLQGPSRRAARQDQVVKVGPYEFGFAEFERTRQNRERMIQAQVGDKYDPHAMGDMLDNLAAHDLVELALLAISAQDLGLQVTTREIEQHVLAEPGFRTKEGKFERAAFEAYTQHEYGSQRAFMAEYRLRLLASKLYSVLQQQPEVSEGEAREAARRDLEQAQIAFALPGAGKGDPPEITADAIAAAIASRGEEIAKIYQEKGDEFNRPERVRARHILRTVAPNAPAEEVERAHQEIQAAAERIAKGEAFEAVAAELSQDPGSKNRGGDLGFFARGQMLKEFEDAAFALTPGQISEPVKTSFGFHLIRLEERQEALVRPLESVRDEIARELLMREALRERSHKRAEELAEAVRGGQTLEAAAKQSEIPVQHSGWLTRQHAFVAGLGNSPDVVAAAFVLAPGSAPRIFEVGDGYALVQVVERKDAAPDQVDALVDKKREELLAAKREARITAWIDARRTALEKSGDLVVNTQAIRGGS
jgi:peptidyl-prolyl cis-trans isomerase D